MNQPLAYLNGEFLPASQLALPVHDLGFVQGVAVSEQLRTFGGRIFRLQDHFRRLHRSLEIIGLSAAVELEQLAQQATELVHANHALLDPADDLGLSLFVTPGPYATFEPESTGSPTVGMHTYPLPFALWAGKYEGDQQLVVSSVRQVPEACWPAELKCRSRMHYYLADREANLTLPGARAILLNEREEVLEASSANIVAYFSNRGLISPPQESILPGVSVAVIKDLAHQLQLPFSHRTLRVDDLLAADEVLLSSTSPCVWPVVGVNGQRIANAKPGEVFQRLLNAWSDLVGVDIRSQANRFATR